MAQGGVLGNGTLIAVSAGGSPTTWTVIPQLLEVSFPQDTADRVEITTHSRINKRKRYMTGLTETSDPSFLVLDDSDETTGTVQETLRQIAAAGTSVWWRIEKPTNRARTKFRGIEFQASIKDFNSETPIGDAQKIRVTLTFDGEDIGFTPAGASAF